MLTREEPAGPGPVVVFGCARPPTGEHLHPQLRRPLLAGHSREGGSST